MFATQSRTQNNTFLPMTNMFVYSCSVKICVWHPFLYPAPCGSVFPAQCCQDDWKSVVCCSALWWKRTEPCLLIASCSSALCGALPQSQWFCWIRKVAVAHGATDHQWQALDSWPWAVLWSCQWPHSTCPSGHSQNKKWALLHRRREDSACPAAVKDQALSAGHLQGPPPPVKPLLPALHCAFLSSSWARWAAHVVSGLCCLMTWFVPK